MAAGSENAEAAITASAGGKERRGKYRKRIFPPASCHEEEKAEPHRDTGGNKEDRREKESFDIPEEKI
jgi:hypothetical protein